MEDGPDQSLSWRGPEAGAYEALWSRRAVCLILAALVWTSARVARGFEVYSGPDLQLRWDTNVKYSAGWRLIGRSPELIDEINSDDGDRNFNRGWVSSRLDLFSEADLLYKSVGARVSAAAWYDLVYNVSNDHDSPATANPISVPHNQFTDGTQELHGRKAEILDAFLFASPLINEVPVTLRVGRHTLLWGQSLLMADNGISNAQAPIDAIKALSVPASQAKELFLPVGQISIQAGPLYDLTVAAFYQFEWRRTRIPAVGSYLSSTDVLDVGGERLFVGPTGTTALFRTADLRASDQGQGGLSLRYRMDAADLELELAFIRYHDKTPQLYLLPGRMVEPPIGKGGEYQLVFHESIQLFGAAFSTTLGPVAIAGEAHVRRGTPLASTPPSVMPGTAADNQDSPLYAVGNTAHALLSGIHVFSPNRLWDSANLVAELGWQRLTATTENPAAVDPRRDRDAWGFRLLFTPTYFQVSPSLDLTLPTSLGLNPHGKGGPLGSFNGGADVGGVVTVGVAGEYRRVWLGSLVFNHYYGDTDFQPRADRGFLSLALQRAF